jgi:hypothetical protein
VLAGIALVGSVGGRRDMLVPVVGPDPVQSDAPVQFISIIRRFREVSLAVVWLDALGVAHGTPFDLPVEHSWGEKLASLGRRLVRLP